MNFSCGEKSVVGKWIHEMANESLEWGEINSMHKLEGGDNCPHDYVVDESKAAGDVVIWIKAPCRERLTAEWMRAQL